MRHTDGTTDDQVTDGLVARLAALDDCLHGVDPDATRLSDGTHAAVGLSHPQLSEAVDAILMLRQAAAADRRPGSDDDSPLPARIGRFEIVRLAGCGGFARVAEAVDPTLNRRVALKVPRPEAILAPTVRRRFLREAEIAARLSHPNIVTIHEVGEADGLAYIAQEFCAGGSLAEWLDEHPGPLQPRAAVQLALTLARAIAYAHDEGVIHRDIKPANVLLMPARPGVLADLPPDLIVKLGDFGLGKAETAADEDGDTQLTRTGARVGTPTWMAPEQVDTAIGPVGPWSDIHALGLLLDRLLTGRCLRSGRTDAETFRQILLDDAPSCDRAQPGLSRDLGAVCLKCLCRNPRDRYASASDVAGDLQRFLDGQPTVARPLSPAARLARGVRRRPLATTLAALAIAAISFAGWASGERTRALARHAATSADMRRHEATAALRRGFDAFRTGNAAAALTQLASCRRVDPALADSFAGRWLEQRVQGEQARLLPVAQEAATPLHDVAISADGGMFAAGAADGRLFIGRLDPHASPTAAKPLITVTAHDEVNGVAFSPDGLHVATVGQDGRLRLWRTADGTPAGEEPPVTAALYGVAFMNDGAAVAYGGDDRVVRIAHLENRRLGAGRPLSFRLPERYLGEIESLCAIDADRLAVAIGTDVLVVDGRGVDPPRVLTTHTETIARLAISADRRLLAVGGHDRSPTVVRTDDGTLVCTIERHPSWVDGCGFSSDGAWLVTAGKDGIARVFDIATGSLEQRFVGHVGRIWDAAFDTRGRVITAGVDGTLRVWDPAMPPERAGMVDVADAAIPAAYGEFLRDFVGGRPLPAAVASTIAFGRATTLDLDVSADTEQATIVGSSGAMLPDDVVAVGCRDGRFILWNTRASAFRDVARFDRGVDCVAATATGAMRLAAGSYREVVIYELEPGAGRASLPQTRVVCRLPDLPGDVHAISWSTDGTRLVCGMNEGLVMVFDAATGAVVGSLAAHERELVGAAYLADGRTLVTADTHNVRISDAVTLATLDEIRPGWKIHGICASADGSTVAIVGELMPATDASAAPPRFGLIAVEPRRAEPSP